MAAPAGAQPKPTGSAGSPRPWRQSRWQRQYAQWQDSTKGARKTLSRERRELPRLLEDEEARRELLAPGGPRPTGDAQRRLRGAIGEARGPTPARLHDAEHDVACGPTPARLRDAEQDMVGEHRARHRVECPGPASELAALRLRLAQLTTEEVQHRAGLVPPEEQRRAAARRAAQNADRARLLAAREGSKQRLAEAARAIAVVLETEEEEDRRLQRRQNDLDRELYEVCTLAERQRLAAEREFKARVDEEEELVRLEERVESLPRQIAVAKLATVSWRRMSEVSNRWGALAKLVLAQAHHRFFDKEVAVLEERPVSVLDSLRSPLPDPSGWEASSHDNFGAAVDGDRMFQLHREVDRTVSEFVSSGFLDLVALPLQALRESVEM